MNTTRIPHAPSTPLPELAEFLEPFHVHFARSEGRQPWNATSPAC